MRAQLDGLTLHYELTGRGKTLTLVHGLGGSADGWAPIVPALAGRYRVLTYDGRGFGRSDKPPGPYSAALFAADLALLLRHLGVEKTYVMGISMGGVVAQRFALDYPEMTEAVVLVSTSARVGPAATAGWLELADVVEERGIGVLRERPVRGYSPRFLAEHGGRVRELTEASVARNEPAAFAAAARAISSYDYTEELSRLTCPVLVVQGADDILTPPGGSVLMARAIPNAELAMIEGCGHGVVVEQPARLTEETLRFLARVAARATAGG